MRKNCYPRNWTRGPGGFVGKTVFHRIFEESKEKMFGIELGFWGKRIGKMDYLNWKFNPIVSQPSYASPCPLVPCGNMSYFKYHRGRSTFSRLDNLHAGLFCHNTQYPSLLDLPLVPFPPISHALQFFDSSNSLGGRVRVHLHEIT